MMFRYTNMYALWWLLCFGLVADVLANQQTKLIVFLVDGLRWDYVDIQQHQGFRWLTQNGVKAHHVVPIVPANSYPNWYSIVTGLYAEEHGMLQNYMYDSDKSSYFRMSSPSSFLPYWWDQAEPLWVRAEKRNIRTAMFWWDGCQVPLQGIKPSFCIPYKGTWSTVNDDVKYNIGAVMTAFKAGSLDMALIYYEGPDAAGHAYGPDSMETRRSVDSFNDILMHLQKELLSRQLDKSVNVVVLSDHGMTNTGAHDVTLINLESFLASEDIHIMLDKGPFSMLHPVPGKEEQVYEKLKAANIPGLEVMQREEIPDYFHFRNNRLAAPILLTTKKGYYLMPLSDARKMDPPPSSSIPRGSHGYNPLEVPDMWASFYAGGPGISKLGQTQPIHMVDIYNVLCYLVGLPPHGNSGSWRRVRNVIDPTYNRPLFVEYDRFFLQRRNA
ncbi:glycerophosphocholine cholinephosphodiesterase ENPP6-like [Ornithodoros turicata]|uniref:glycerophosphocholine cholinephosphodiesterase ENPP6-like n=1 Tax=Ornithodoros turicata TaxID=34597 RepID=UPI003139D77C